MPTEDINRTDRLLRDVMEAIREARVECDGCCSSQKQKPRDIQWDETKKKWSVYFDAGPDHWQRIPVKDRTIILCPECLPKATIVVGSIQVAPR